MYMYSIVSIYIYIYIYIHTYIHKCIGRCILGIASLNASVVPKRGVLARDALTRLPLRVPSRALSFWVQQPHSSVFVSPHVQDLFKRSSQRGPLSTRTHHQVKNISSAPQVAVGPRRARSLRTASSVQSQSKKPRAAFGTG